MVRILGSNIKQQLYQLDFARHFPGVQLAWRLFLANVVLGFTSKSTSGYLHTENRNLDSLGLFFKDFLS